jgi:hypothetical protein
MHEFITVFRLYRKRHGIVYALRRAWHITIQGAPF